MRQNRFCIKDILCLFLSASACFSAGGQQVITVENTGRRIQRDGFLLEWRIDQSHIIDTAADIRLDAVNTPEGVAGYIRVRAKEGCGGWVFRVYPRLGQGLQYVEMSADTSGGRGRFHAVDVISADTVVHAAIEWVIPWDSLPLDPAGKYAIGIRGNDTCGDTLGGVIISGVRGGTERKNNSTGLMNQVILIGVLLTLYLALKARSKKYMKGLNRDPVTPHDE